MWCWLSPAWNWGLQNSVFRVSKMQSKRAITLWGAHFKSQGGKNLTQKVVERVAKVSENRRSAFHHESNAKPAKYQGGPGALPRENFDLQKLKEKSGGSFGLWWFFLAKQCILTWNKKIRRAKRGAKFFPVALFKIEQNWFAIGERSEPKFFPFSSLLFTGKCTTKFGKSFPKLAKF